MDCQFKKQNLDFKNPFLVDGKIVCSLRILGQKVLIWSDPKVDKIGSIWLPPQVGYTPREKLRMGVVLSIGPGYYDSKKKKFVTTSLSPGQRVVFDATTPWEIDVTDPTGKVQKVRLMTELDVKGIVNCCNCVECNF